MIPPCDLALVVTKLLCDFFCSTNEAWKKAQEALAATQTKPATESTSSNSSNISAAAAAVSAGNVQSFLQAGPLPQMAQGAPPPGWMPHPNPAFPKYVHLCIYLTSASILVVIL